MRAATSRTSKSHRVPIKWYHDISSGTYIDIRPNSLDVFRARVKNILLKRARLHLQTHSCSQQEVSAATTKHFSLKKTQKKNTQSEDMFHSHPPQFVSYLVTVFISPTAAWINEMRDVSMLWTFLGLKYSFINWNNANEKFFFIFSLLHSSLIIPVSFPSEGLH